MRSKVNHESKSKVFLEKLNKFKILIMCFESLPKT